MILFLLRHFHHQKILFRLHVVYPHQCSYKLNRLYDCSLYEVNKFHLPSMHSYMHDLSINLHLLTLVLLLKFYHQTLLASQDLNLQSYLTRHYLAEIYLSQMHSMLTLLLFSDILLPHRASKNYLLHLYAFLPLI